MIMSVGKSSVKMSVYERTDVDEERRDKDPGIERSDGRGAESGGSGGADGGERAPYVVTTGRLQEGGSICHNSREQGEKAGGDH